MNLGQLLRQCQRAIRLEKGSRLLFGALYVVHFLLMLLLLLYLRRAVGLGGGR